VVATKLKGIKSIIGENNGVVYAGDVNDFVKRTASLLKNKRTSERISEAGYRYVKKTHDLDRIAKDLERVVLKTKRNF